MTAEPPAAQKNERSVRKRDAGRTRATILRAATREFGLNGFSGARTERIATLAKCNIRLLYHHFGNKKALYQTVLEVAYGDLRAREAALAFDFADPLGCVETLLRFTFAYYERNPVLDGLLRAENTVRGRFMRQSASMGEAAARLRAILARIIAEGEARGIFRSGIDPADLYVTVTALSRFHLANVYSLSILLDRDLHSPKWRAARLEHGVAMLRVYLTMKPAA